MNAGELKYPLDDSTMVILGELDIDECDALHLHFGTVKFRDWCDVSDEGCRVFGLAVDGDSESIEQFSLIDGVISAVAAAGYNLAIDRAAKFLGVDRDSLYSCIDCITQNYDPLDRWTPTPQAIADALREAGEQLNAANVEAPSA